MRLLIVNQFALETPEGTVRRLRTRKTEELLAYLALNPQRWISREEAIDRIWEEPDENGRQKLRLALHSIRSVIGKHLETDGDLLRIVDLQVDADDQQWLLSLPAGWRLMPEHQVDWLDHHAASLQVRLQMTALQSLSVAPQPPQDRATQLAFLISQQPHEPELYRSLHDLFLAEGQAAAARVVASFARANLPKEGQHGFEARMGRTVPRDFRGRLSELAHGAAALLSGQEPAFLQVVALGGMGKTRLALELSGLASEEEIPVAWADLTHVEDSDQARAISLAALSTALQLSESEVQDPMQISSVLWVLDNADSLPLDGLEFLHPYLRPGCGARILVTSQHAMGDLGPCLSLSPLGLPQSSRMEVAEASDALSLLLHHSGLNLAQENFAPLLQLVQESGGIPLAIVMLGASCRIRPVDDVLTELRAASHKLKFRSGTTSHPARHQSLQATLDWGYQHLSDSCAQALLHLCQIEGEWDQSVLDELGVDEETHLNLVEAQWVTRKGEAYSLLPPVSSYLREHSTVRAEVTDKVRAFLLREIGDNYPGSYGRVSVLAERYRVMIDRLLEEPDLSPRERGLLLVGAQVTAARFHRMQFVIDGLQEVLQKEDDSALRNLLAAQEYLRYNFEAALPHFQSLTRSEDEETRGIAETNIGLILLSTGRTEEAVPTLERAVGMTSHPRRRATRMINLCSAYGTVGRFQEAVRLANEAIDAFTEMPGHEGFVALSYVRRGEAQALSGDYRAAIESGLIAMDLFDKGQQGHHQVDGFCLLMTSCASQRDRAAAREWGQRLLEARPLAGVVAGAFHITLHALGEQERGADFARAVDQLRLPLFLGFRASQLGIRWQGPAPSLRSREVFALAHQALKRF